MATFKRIGDTQFLDICKDASEQDIIDAVKGGANVHAKGRGNITALMLAAKKNYFHAIRVLVKAGAEVNAREDPINPAPWQIARQDPYYKGYTALTHAVMRNNAEAAEALVEAGADINITVRVNIPYDSRYPDRPCYDDQLLMLYAIEHDCVGIVKALSKAGTKSINIRFSDGGTYLIFAARWSENREIINALIEAGADDVADNEGMTALMYAASRNKPIIVSALINAGAYVKAKSREGKMARDYARMNPRLNGSEALKRLNELSASLTK